MTKLANISTASTAPSAPLSSIGPVKFQAVHALTDCSQCTHEIREGYFSGFKDNGDGSVTATYESPTDVVTLTLAGTKFTSVREKKEDTGESDNRTTGTLVKERAGPTGGWKAVVEEISEDGNEISGHFENINDA